VGRGGARLEGALETRVEGRDADVDGDGVHFGERPEEVEVPRDERVLRHDRDRVQELREDLDAPPRDLELPFEGLVGIRHAREGDDLGLPSRRRELLAKQLRGALLHQDLGLEVEAGGVAEVLVGRPRIAVGAAVFAPAIGVQARVEGNVRAVVRRERGP
jgi:hypothetical protein